MHLSLRAPRIHLIRFQIPHAIQSIHWNLWYVRTQMTCFAEIVRWLLLRLCLNTCFVIYLLWPVLFHFATNLCFGNPQTIYSPNPQKIYNASHRRRVRTTYEPSKGSSIMFSHLDRQSPKLEELPLLRRRKRKNPQPRHQMPLVRAQSQSQSREPNHQQKVTWY